MDLTLQECRVLKNVMENVPSKVARSIYMKAAREQHKLERAERDLSLARKVVLYGRKMFGASSTT